MHYFLSFTLLAVCISRVILLRVHYSNALVLFLRTELFLVSYYFCHCFVYIVNISFYLNKILFCKLVLQSNGENSGLKLEGERRPKLSIINGMDII